MLSTTIYQKAVSPSGLLTKRMTTFSYMPTELQEKSLLWNAAKLDP